jgi:hypothetical protein
LLSCLDRKTSIYTSHVTGMTATSYHTLLFVELGVLWIFCSNWPQT